MAVYFYSHPQNRGYKYYKDLRGEVCDKHHLTYRSFKSYSPEMYKSYFTFSIVRNPFTRLVSAYRYQKSVINEDPDRFDPLYLKIFQKHNTFEEFVIDFLSKDFIYTASYYKPQHAYLYGKLENRQVDFLGRYESLDSDFQALSKRIGFKGDLIYIHKTDAQSPIESADYLYKCISKNTELKEKILYLYEYDYEIFNYEQDFNF